MTKTTKVKYRIRFTEKVSCYNPGDYYHTNTRSEWNSKSMIKSLITREGNYWCSALHNPAHYEIVEVTEVIESTERVITLD